MTRHEGMQFARAQFLDLGCMTEVLLTNKHRRHQLMSWCLAATMVLTKGGMGYDVKLLTLVVNVRSFTSSPLVM